MATMIDSLFSKSASEIARLLRSRELSATDVVEAHGARIRQVNPMLNAVVRHRFEQARQEALLADQRFATEDPEQLPPFLGVPCTIKEHYQVKGFPNTAGLLKRRHAYASEDAVLVQRMRDAGFIIMGITNVPEALLWYESYNKVYGRTNNAYLQDHTPGGSSGGEGAIIGAGASPIGLGGDIGGSIRMPAFFNGIVGHKATGGRVPETGCWPGATGQLARYKVCGPLARRVEDLQNVMPILAGPDGKDTSVNGPEWGKSPVYSPQEINVYYFESNGMLAPSSDVRAGVQTAVQALRERGCKVEAWRPPGIERGLEIWAAALTNSGGHKYIESLGDFGPVNLAQQWLRWPLGNSDHIFPCLALATVEQLFLKFPKYGKAMSDQRQVLRDEIESKLGSNGVLIFPPFHRTAPRHGAHAVLHTLGFVYSGVVNPLELPSTSVPTGFSEQGLPVGVQVVGSRYQDHLTLFVARELEQALGGWDPSRLPAFHGYQR
jgi:fatty acid amide hydrolase 2